MATTKHSAYYATALKRWEQGRIDENMLRLYVRAGRLTAEEFEEITGIPYEE